jgi:hypothetical protein
MKALFEKFRAAYVWLCERIEKENETDERRLRELKSK